MNDYLVSFVEKIIEQVEIDGSVLLDKNNELYWSLKNWYEDFIKKNIDEDNINEDFIIL